MILKIQFSSNLNKIILIKSKQIHHQVLKNNKMITELNTRIIK